jgi:hypothetical protein
MKRVSFAGIVALFILCVVAACTKNDVQTVDDPIGNTVRSQISALGFSHKDAMKTEGGYIVEGDIFLREEDLTAAPTSPNMIIAKEEHYRTFNTVTGLPRNITVSISSSAPSYFITALTEAIRRYNAEGLRVTFTRVTGTAAINIVLYYAADNTLGSAGFPSSGNPYNQIRMNTYHYRSSTNTNYLATIIAHEMGHCIGFRHTDYMNRAYSCGTGGNEGQSTTGVGAVHIPGTPTGPSSASWMLACSNGTNRPFTSNDRIALQYVY